MIPLKLAGVIRFAILAVVVSFDFKVRLPLVVKATELFKVKTPCNSKVAPKPAEGKKSVLETVKFFKDLNEAED